MVVVDGPGLSFGEHLTQEGELTVGDSLDGELATMFAELRARARG